MDDRNLHLSFFRNIFLRHRRELLLILLAMVLSTGFTMLAPLWSKTLIDTVLPLHDLSRVVQHIFLGILLALSMEGGKYGRNFMRYRLGNRICAEIRQLLFGKIIDFPFATMNKYSRGDLISRLSIDVSILQEGIISGVFVFLPNLLTVAGLVIIMFWHSFYLAMLILLLLPFIATTINVFNRKIRAKARTAQDELARLTGLVEEAATGFKEIKSFANEDLVKQRFHQANKETLEAYSDQDRTRALGPFIVLIIAFIGIGTLMLISAWTVFRGVSSIGDVVAFLTCLFLSYAPIERISSSFGSMSRMYGAFDRLDELLKAPQEQEVSEKVPASSITRGTIEFQDIGFSYPQGFQLHNVNLFIKAGETVAVAGPNGSGKTTLLSLVPRFLEADKGTILIDGLDVKEYSIHGLRRHIAFVFQEPVLFDGTLLENLSFAKPGAPDEEIFAAARAAHVDDFALQLPNGYETQIGQYGSNLSAGQRQRISIARALLKDPKILIMDEPTSALDAESDRLITDSLSLLMKSRTTIIVSHRVSAIRTADRIVLMDGGRLTECDTHPEFLEAKGLHLVQA